MMTILLFLFGFCTLYALVLYKLGVAMISAFMIGLTIYGKRELRKRDIEFYLDPSSAKKAKPEGVDALEEQECESSRDKI